eukprot:gnl/TRDRNA2_/TRDRNA2_130305_c0_seq1.p1 gnl/TRDRNA2_/TRDRNA2_130305_c0~~gnl/TRDRNA2_/TRDRNA2_130305_c0_seq1.p1  ORF type:complete len:1179 (+),score=325.02 gnl/TRDRNA2_/TRDRNA2_130305_c0_seq1:302-3538(+)
MGACVKFRCTGLMVHESRGDIGLLRKMPPEGVPNQKAWDSSAISTQSIEKPMTGFRGISCLSFSTNRVAMMGLASGSGARYGDLTSSHTGDSVDFGIAFYWRYTFTVYEGGKRTGDFGTWADGDRLEIVLNDQSHAEYRVNGYIRYVSQKVAKYPLFAKVIAGNPGYLVSDMRWVEQIEDSMPAASRAADGGELDTGCAQKEPLNRRRPSVQFKDETDDASAQRPADVLEERTDPEAVKAVQARARALLQQELVETRRKYEDLLQQHSELKMQVEAAKHDDEGGKSGVVSREEFDSVVDESKELRRRASADEKHFKAEVEALEARLADALSEQKSSVPDDDSDDESAMTLPRAWYDRALEEKNLLGQECAALKQKYELLEEQHAALKDQMEAAKDESDGGDRSRASLEEEIAGIQGKYEHLQEQHNVLKVLFEAAKDEPDGGRSRKLVEEELDVTRRKFEDLQGKHDAVLQQSSLVGKQEATLLLQEKSLLEEELAGMKQRYEDLQEEHAVLKVQFEAVKDDPDGDASRATLMEEVATMREWQRQRQMSDSEELDLLDQKLAEVMEQREELRQQHLSAEARLEATATSEASQRSECERLLADKAQLDEKLMEMGQKHEDVQKRYDVLLAEVEANKALRNDSEATQKFAQQSNQSGNAALLEELAEMTQKHAEVQERYDSVLVRHEKKQMRQAAHEKSLEDKLAELTTKHEAAQAELAKMQASEPVNVPPDGCVPDEALRAQLQKHESQHSELVLEHSALNSRYEDALAKLVASEVSHSEVAEELSRQKSLDDQLADRAQTVLEQYEEMKEKLQTSEEDQASLQQKLHDTESQLSTLRQGHERCETEGEMKSEAALKQCTMLQRQLRASEARSSELAEEADEERRAAQVSRDELEARLSELQESAEQDELCYESAKAAEQAALKQCATLHRQLRASELQCSELAEAKPSSSDDMKQKAEAAEERCDRLQATLESREIQHTEMVQQLLSMQEQEQVKAATSRIQLNAQMDELERELRALQHENERLETELASRDDQCISMPTGGTSRGRLDAVAEEMPEAVAGEDPSPNKPRKKKGVTTR